MGKTGKKKMGGSVIFLVLLMMLVVLGSCRTPAGRTPGEVVDDSTITTKVKAKIFEDSVMKGMGISVDTFDGQVTLTGAVETPQQKDRAGELARSVYGVKKVNNLLNIKKNRKSFWEIPYFFSQNTWFTLFF
jgi:hyperosmotically inducible protein